VFKECINDSPLTTGCAREYFGSKIYADTFINDESFAATLNALVVPRMKDSDIISVVHTGSSYSIETIRSNRAVAIINATVKPDSVHNDRIVVHNLTNNEENNEAHLQMYSKNLTEHYEGWVQLEKVTEFFRKTFKVLCFINASKRSVILIVDNLDLRKYHYLQCSTLAFLPWYFDKTAGITEDEMELIQSLREKTPDRYLACLNKIAENMNFREMFIRNKLRGFETRFLRNEIANIKDEIGGLIGRIDEYNSSIASFLRSKSDLEIRLLGLQLKVNEGESEETTSDIMQYFLNNKRLNLQSVDDRVMSFIAQDYITYFDEDMASRMINNRSSYIYRPDGANYSRHIQESDMERLMTAIFIDCSIKIKVCAAYKFVLNGNVQALNGYRFPSEFNNCMPNPHINTYSCLGSYEYEINKLLSKNDYIGALEQCVASVKSLNFGDSIVMVEFMKDLYTDSRCYLELPDGRMVSPKEAVKWLKEQE